MKLCTPKPRVKEAKQLGVFYTDLDVARYLARWAIRSPSDTLLDPCFGGGVFLRAACERYSELIVSPRDLLYGIEIDPKTYCATGSEFIEKGLCRAKQLVQGDFFAFDVPSGQVTAVIGNPPFVRYQRFTGESRKRALSRCIEHGVHLPELSSSWAPFLVHSIACIQQGGRLAMVLPMEIAHAKYALPVLDHVRRSFGNALFLTFRQKLFPSLNEDALLLLASDRGDGPCEFQIRDLASAASLNLVKQFHIHGARRVDSASIASGHERLIEFLIPNRARLLYRDFIRSGRGKRLGEFADIGIGYVTGANDFFHLDPSEARHWKLPKSLLKPIVRRGRALQCLRFDSSDWKSASERGDAGFLLHLDGAQSLPSSVDNYLQHGIAEGVPEAYKCRMRTPWFAVPNVYRPDAFLTYMSGESPRFVVNDAGVYAPNTLHVVRLRRLFTWSATALAVLWQTSLSQLSVEIEGHALGGGMLKLEPTEAKNVLIPFDADMCHIALAEFADELEKLYRSGNGRLCQQRADQVILQGMLGLTQSDCAILQDAIGKLRNRRGYFEDA